MERVKAHDGEVEILTRRSWTPTDGVSCHFLDLTVMPPGTTIGLHRHSSDNEEYYVVISGQGEMQIEDLRFPVSQGHVVVNRPGGAHALANVGDCPLQLVVIEIPNRESIRD
jgi:mannose-6-phosphate isomerase-like protein (cupin superfamily)